jgi:hypothetical protein
MSFARSTTGVRRLLHVGGNRRLPVAACTRQVQVLPDLKEIVARAEAAWMAHQMTVQQQVSQGQLAETEAQALCGERSKGKWLREHLLERWGLSL